MKYLKNFGIFLLPILCVYFIPVIVVWNTRCPYKCNIFETVENLNNQSEIRYTVLPKSEPTNSNDTKYILLWSSFFERKDWWQADGNDEEYLERTIDCKRKQCVLTNIRNLLPSPLDYDALVFHAAQPWHELGEIPDKRGPHQSYVMATLESPVHTCHDLQKDRNFFNITMTYRLDSDVVWSSYGSFADQMTGAQVAPLPNGQKPNWRKPDESFFDQQLFDQVTNKSKMGAWFVSNCDAPSRRDRLVEKLQRRIPVDVYGKCGHLKCPRDSNRCNEMLDTDYKFYMAFENTLCHDYVTEKLFGTMKRLIIPVVYGGADYSLFVPPHSYIDANDFDTANDLAEYLMFLDQNPREYVKYFWWKQFYRIEHPSVYCDLCQRLHGIADQGVGQFYGDIESWWVVNQCKGKARIKF